ncbi:Alpha/Beta hydrolase protein, partial [Coniella lustricola]
QPFATLFTLYRIVDGLLRLPFWLARSLIPALRPVRDWTFKQSFTLNTANTVVDYQSTLGITPRLSLTPGSEGPRWTILDPFPGSFYRGPLQFSAASHVRPATIGGTWHGLSSAPIPDADPVQPSSTSTLASLTRIALHLHGGAFVTGSGRDSPDLSGYLGSVLTTSAGFDAAFFPQYRLAGYGGQDPFPAALQDSLTAWLYLVRTLGIPAERITVSGDSAGGNLAIALVRYIEAFGAEGGNDGGDADTIPRPANLVLLSPWLNPSAVLRSKEVAHSAYRANPLTLTDYVPFSFLKWGAETYVAQAESINVQRGGGGAAQGKGNVWTDPLHYDFVTQVPLFLTWAGLEMLSVDCAKWAERL